MPVSLVAGTAALLYNLGASSGRIFHPGINVAAIPADNLCIKWIDFTLL